MPKKAAQLTFIIVKLYFMRIFIAIIYFVLFHLPASAQNAGKISGTVLQNGKPAEGATASLLRAKDSASIKLSASNKEGLFVF